MIYLYTLHTLNLCAKSVPTLQLKCDHEILWKVQHLTWLIKVVVDIDMLEGVPGIFALLCAVENQSHKVPVTTNDLTGVHAAHSLQGQNTNPCYHRTSGVWIPVFSYNVSQKRSPFLQVTIVIRMIYALPQLCCLNLWWHIMISKITSILGSELSPNSIFKHFQLLQHSNGYYTNRRD